MKLTENVIFVKIMKRRRNKMNDEKQVMCQRLLYKDWTQGNKEIELFGIVESKTSGGMYFRTSGITNKRYFIRLQDQVKLEDTTIQFIKGPM